MNEEKVPDGIEERLKKQEAALEALKDVPTMLASLIGQGKIDKPEMKSTWSLGLSDEEDQQDFEKDADNLLGNVQSKDDGELPPQIFLFSRRYLVINLYLLFVNN